MPASEIVLKFLDNAVPVLGRQRAQALSSRLEAPTHQNGTFVGRGGHSMSDRTLKAKDRRPAGAVLDEGRIGPSTAMTLGL